VVVPSRASRGVRRVTSKFTLGVSAEVERSFTARLLPGLRSGPDERVTQISRHD
jgi:hypothetical protein